MASLLQVRWVSQAMYPPDIGEPIRCINPSQFFPDADFPGRQRSEPSAGEARSDGDPFSGVQGFAKKKPLNYYLSPKDPYTPKGAKASQNHPLLKAF